MARRSRWWMFVLVMGLMVVAGCAWSPEAKKARHLERGDSLGELGRAVRYFLKSQELDPANVNARLKLGRIYDLLVSYRSGHMWAPRVDPTEAPRLETRYFLGSVASGERPFNDGLASLRVVRMLEAAEESLKRRGETVYPASR